MYETHALLVAAWELNGRLAGVEGNVAAYAEPEGESEQQVLKYSLGGSCERSMSRGWDNRGISLGSLDRGRAGNALEAGERGGAKMWLSMVDRRQRGERAVRQVAMILLSQWWASVASKDAGRGGLAGITDPLKLHWGWVGAGEGGMRAVL